MNESGYYPPGTEFNPDAPWNEKDIPKRTFNVCVSQTLSKNTRVLTNDYSPEINQEETGTYIDTDTSDTNWKLAYSEEHYTPLELIGLFKKHLENTLPDPIIDVKGYKESMRLIKECEEWIEDEFEVLKN